MDTQTEPKPKQMMNKPLSERGIGVLALVGLLSAVPAYFLIVLAFWWDIAHVSQLTGKPVAVVVHTEIR